MRMRLKWLVVVVFLALAGSSSQVQGKYLQAGNITLRERADSNGIDFEIGFPGDTKLRGKLGLSLPIAIGTASSCTSDDPNTQCFGYGDFAKLTVTSPNSGNDNCARIEWESTFARRLEDCFSIEDGNYMYGGSEIYDQYWPTNSVTLNENAYVTGDFAPYAAVLENYWLFSSGVAIHVDENNPLFVSWDTVRSKQLCFVSSDTHPYNKRDLLTLKYDVCIGDNIKAVHQSTMNKFYKKPLSLPDETMLVRPLWSTWAQYKSDINQTSVLEYAKRVVSEGFELSSHIEIDDNWEPCYGTEEFDTLKFPDPAAMVEEIKAMNLRVTLWVHPFINLNCPLFETGVAEGYFVKDQKDKTAITTWWAGQDSGIIDVTNPAAVEWWVARLKKLKTNFGIDAFKFDAGEVNMLPYSVNLSGDDNLSPNIYSSKYIETIAQFGGLVEGRTARLNQEHPVFMRMLDKDTRWEHHNGLRSMIPSALQFGILGYPFVLPDMIGGNAYNGDWPSKELYIRWLQVNVFMPAIQFSIVPWDESFDAETIQITKSVLNLREQFRNEILAAANQAVVDGTPINRPLWWIDPTDPVSFTEGQTYLMGDGILVAPVVEEGATSRDIYLPKGTWTAWVDNATYTGPLWLRDYPAPLSVVPVFIKSD